MELPFSLSRQASLALLGYLLVAVALFLPVKSAGGDKEKESYKLMDRLGVFAMMLIPMALSVYTINCLVAGQCNLWSWVNSALVFLWSIIIFGVSVYAVFRSPAAAVAAPPAAEPFQTQLPSTVGSGSQLAAAPVAVAQMPQATAQMPAVQMPTVAQMPQVAAPVAQMPVAAPPVQMPTVPQMPLAPQQVREGMRPYQEEEHMRPYQSADQENFASVENM